MDPCTSLCQDRCKVGIPAGAVEEKQEIFGGSNEVVSRLQDLLFTVPVCGTVGKPKKPNGVGGEKVLRCLMV